MKKLRTAFTAALFGAAIATTVCAGASAQSSGSILPNGWRISPPSGQMRETDTMPQGAAASADGKILAVVASGFNPATLRLYDATTLAQIAVVPLRGAFGRPVWISSRHVLVAGDNADALFDVDVDKRSATKIAMPPKSHPVEIARAGDGTIAVADDGDGMVRIGRLDEIATARTFHVGRHPGPLAFSSDGQTLFATDRAASSVTAIDRTSLHTGVIKTGVHPSDVLVVGDELYVAASDADAVDVFDVATRRHIADIFVGDDVKGAHVSGTSPNALASRHGLIFVSLGAANSVAVLRDHHLVTRLAAGWYPTDVVPIGDRLFVIDGKGERTRPNPQFEPKKPGYNGYIGSIQYGSIRTLDVDRIATSMGSLQGAAGWQQTVDNAVVRPHGPIEHIFFILKENRSYDQVLGDMSEGNGDPSLVWFGAAVTPNQHALARRFGLFDNAYASGEVSNSGHNWADGAFANDYVERLWPPTYGGRRDDDDMVVGTGASKPPNGYIWDAAAAAHVSFRDYGELAGRGGTTAPTLRGRFDPKYVSWDLDYSDLDRVKEWSREFDAFVKNGTLPRLEYVWLPNDHTSGSRPGKVTPVAYVATNDYAVGQMVDKISHSTVWKSSAIFIIEDDAQDGSDHVSDQRTTLYVASPYARGGVIHDHYSTMSVLRTIEIILGMKPLSAYDAMAVPLYDAFSGMSNASPYHAVRPHVDLSAKNATTAYGARISATLDFSRPDAIPQGVLLNILARNHTNSSSH